MKRTSYVMACAALMTATVVSGVRDAQADIVSTFDTDLDGWVTAGDVSSYTWQAGGGNPDGYARIVDAATGAIFYAVAPAKFLGNQSAAIGNTFSFDALRISGTSTQLAEFGQVTITGGGDAATLDFGGVPTPGIWSTFSQPLTAAAWGKSDAAWLNIMSNITDIRIRMEMINGNETVGLDNVVLVPEPASVALLAGGALALMRRRR